MNISTRLLSVFLIVLVVLSASAVWAFRNVCPVCRTMAEPESTICGQCNRPINQCLGCGQLNPVKADVCSGCSANLDESRSLGQIDIVTRDELQLGQTERSLLKRQLGQIENLLKKSPANAEHLMFRKGDIYMRLENWGRAVSSFYAFQKAYPSSALREQSKVAQSIALTKIGWMGYEYSDPQVALEKFQEAAKANPKNSKTWDLIGQMYLALDNVPGATAAYEKALEINPADATAKELLKEIKSGTQPGPDAPREPMVPSTPENASESSAEPPSTR